MYKVSVIIPVYSVSDYIERCAESLFRQTLGEIQYIFVDDASPDDSIAKLERTLERYPLRKADTIILRHPNHKSIPEARATGLAYAEAPYVAHCDSDDFVEPDMYERLYETAVREQADMVVCGYYYENADGMQTTRTLPSSASDYLNDFLFGRVRRTVWCRLTRTDLYRKVRFSSDNYLEDWVQVAQLIVFCKHIVYLNEPLYHQVWNPESVTRIRRLDLVEEDVRQSKANYYKIHDCLTDNGLAKEDDFIVLKSHVRMRYAPLFRFFRGRKAYLNTFPELNWQIFRSPHFGLIFKLLHLSVLLGISPLVYPIAKPIYNRFAAMRRKRISITEYA